MVAIPHLAGLFATFRAIKSDITSDKIRLREDLSGDGYVLVINTERWTCSVHQYWDGQFYCDKAKQESFAEDVIVLYGFKLYGDVYDFAYHLNHLIKLLDGDALVLQLCECNYTIPLAIRNKYGLKRFEWYYRYNPIFSKKGGKKLPKLS